MPKELSDLCDLELHLISQILPFSKIVGLRGGAYQGVKGESVYVPIEPDKVAQTVKHLPRKLTDSELIPLKLKRRLRYRGYYMYQTIRRHGVDAALKWLKKNNKHYRDIEYNENWHKIEEESPQSEDYQNLLSKSENVRHDVKIHDSGDEKDKEDEGDIVEGQNIIYDTTLVDDVPKLPVREDGNAFSIAPGEGKIPTSRLTKDLDQLAFPGMFPYGECSYDDDRGTSLTIKRYYNSLTFRQGSRCVKPTFIFHAQSQVEKQQLQSSINFQSKKGFGGDPNVKKLIDDAIKGNKAWQVFKQVRTTPGYWDNAKKKL